jgi:hypothetical protein
VHIGTQYLHTHVPNEQRSNLDGRERLPESLTRRANRLMSGANGVMISSRRQANHAASQLRDYASPHHANG